MQFVQGVGDIRKAFQAIEENINRDAWQIPKKISDSWVFMIHLTDAIDTGDYLRSVNWHPQNTGDEMQQFIVNTSDNEQVDYEGFVEGGTKYMAARFPARKAIEREDFVQSITGMIEQGLEI